jgi:hypothetical protein
MLSNVSIVASDPSATCCDAKAWCNNLNKPSVRATVVGTKTAGPASGQSHHHPTYRQPKSLWDILPFDVTELIFKYCDILTLYLNHAIRPSVPSRLLDKTAATSPSGIPENLARQIWNTALETDWDGDLRLLPQHAGFPDIFSGLLNVRSRDIYQRLCAFKPEFSEYLITAAEQEDLDTLHSYEDYCHLPSVQQSSDSNVCERNKLLDDALEESLRLRYLNHDRQLNRRRGNHAAHYFLSHFHHTQSHRLLLIPLHHGWFDLIPKHQRQLRCPKALLNLSVYFGFHRLFDHVYPMDPSNASDHSRAQLIQVIEVALSFWNTEKSSKDASHYHYDQQHYLQTHEEAYIHILQTLFHDLSYSTLQESEHILFNLLCAASKTGLPRLYRFLESHPSLVNILSNNSNNNSILSVPVRPFLCAVAEGQMEMMEYLYPKVDRRLEFAHHGFLESAAQQGRLDVLKYAWERQGEFRAYKSGWSEEVVDAAAKGGHLKVLKWLFEMKNAGSVMGGASGGELWGEGSEAILGKVVINGYVDILEYLIGVKPSLISHLSMARFKLAATRGHGNVVRWFYENCQRYWPEVILSPLSSASSPTTTKKERINNLNSIGPQIRIFFSQFLFHHGLNKFIRTNDIETIRYLYDRHVLQDSDFQEAHLRLAIQHGSLEILQWMNDTFDLLPHAHENHQQYFDPTQRTLMDEAAHHNQLGILQWLTTTSFSPSAKLVLHQSKTSAWCTAGVTTEAIESASCKGNLEMLKWILEKKTETSSSSGMSDGLRFGLGLSLEPTPKSLHLAACQGHLQVLRYLVRYIAIAQQEIKGTVSSYVSSSKWDSASISQSGGCGCGCFCQPETIGQVAINGDLEILHFLLSLRQRRFKGWDWEHFVPGKAWSAAMSHGQVGVADWVMDGFKEEIDVNATYDWKGYVEPGY